MCQQPAACLWEQLSGAVLFMLEFPLPELCSLSMSRSHPGSLSCLLYFLCMLVIPIFKFEEFSIYLSRLLIPRGKKPSLHVYTQICIILTEKPASSSPSPLFLHRSITTRFVTTNTAGFAPWIYCYIYWSFSNEMTVYNC